MKKLKDLHIKQVDSAIVRRLKIAAAKNKMTLKDYVLHTLQAAMEDEQITRSRLRSMANT